MDRRFNSRARLMKSTASGAWAIQDRALELAASGREIIFLTVGDPNFDTPSAIIEAGCSALRSGRTHYSQVPGEPSLRDAIAGRYKTARENVIVFTGAQAALFAVLQVLVERGDEVLILEPYYATYPVAVIASGATAVSVACEAENSFLPRIEDLEGAVTSATRAIIVNSPSNPTGAALGINDVQMIITFARRHNLWVIADEVYSGLCFDAPHIGFWPLADPSVDRIAVIDSFSKTFAMSGWRLGWLAGPPDLIDNLVTLSEGSQFGCAQFIQDAALVALQEPLAESVAMRDAYRERRNLVIAALNGIPGVRCTEPAGGMFVMADIRTITHDCRAFAAGLLNDEGVAMIPGAGFGGSSSGHLRISLAQSCLVLEEAMQRLKRFVKHRRHDFDQEINA